MCETYGLDVTTEGLDGDEPARPLFVAALCAQLPQRCRVNRAEDPNLAWSQEQWTLWVLPAPAGMIRRPGSPRTRRGSAPRTRGDDPVRHHICELLVLERMLGEWADEMEEERDGDD